MGQEYKPLCKIANINGVDHLVIPDGGIPLNHKGPMPHPMNTTGIYIIHENGTSNSYVGSSIHIGERVRHHYDLATSSKTEGTSHLLYSKVQAKGGEHFTVTPIHLGTNFLSMLMASEASSSLFRDITHKDYTLLDAFTKYELAVVEQSYLDKMRSTLNGRHIATTSSHPTMFDNLSSLAQITSEEPEYVDYKPAPELHSTPLRDLSH